MTDSAGVKMLVQRNYKDGRIYTGQTLGQHKHGHGIMVWKGQPGEKYINFYHGDWIHDRMTGHGRRHFANGDVYEGEFIDDQFQGRGLVVFEAQPGDECGHYYVGEWLQGDRIGHG